MRSFQETLQTLVQLESELLCRSPHSWLQLLHTHTHTHTHTES